MSLSKILLFISLPLLLLAPIENSQFSRDVKTLSKFFNPSSEEYNLTTYENATLKPETEVSAPATSATTENSVALEQSVSQSTSQVEVPAVVQESPEVPVAETPVVEAQSVVPTEPEITVQVVEKTNTILELEFGEENYLEFIFDASKDGYVLVGGAQCSGELYIPDYIEGKPVVEIGANAFSDNEKLTGSLYLPSTIKIIGEYAFSGCSGLSGILVLPSELEELGSYAFENVTLSGDIVFPATLRTVGEGAFKNASFDGSVYLNDGLKTIGNYAFANSNLCGDVFVPASVESYGSEVFKNCENVKGIYHVSGQGYLVEEGDL